MPWKQMLAYVIGEVEDSLLLRIEYSPSISGPTTLKPVM